ncbi:hypothetical protein [Edaphosphingomonas haloaromaticamans]|uniref:Uncharacterized protein n=1 Tax=Edaphosphingomonas haloaromaticamans TaxID=653954 RepID=A0A1S1HCC9_9SPHN|nr:hypothetical protein [Sphingomonas haloaromaticamans]OHT19111.1 hypothetical protein BHE75_01094 [Sphingomonas haloaromaticamans]
MSDPRRRSGSTAIVTIAAWFDLYAYGSEIEEACFDPADFRADKPIKRLRAFQRIVRENSTTMFPTLVINDGAAVQTNIEEPRSDKAWLFIQRCWKLYREATDADNRSGGLGLRAVIAVGLRAKGARAGIVAQEEEHTAIIDALASGEIDRDEAVKRARPVRRVFDIAPALQANFAFTRAYEAESSGKKGGFPGPAIYLDTMILKDGAPDWLVAGTPKLWRPSKTSLSTLFISIEGMSPPDDATARASLRTGRELRALLSYPGGRRFCKDLS